MLGPGEVVVEIVPMDEDLVVEARISPSEIGRVRIGQNADVKVDSYEPGRYGTVRGKLRRISASTYLDELAEPYYRAEIELEKDHVGTSMSGLWILPGMTVQADIITGEKTILEYLICPVSRGFDESFRER